MTVRNVAIVEAAKMNDYNEWQINLEIKRIHAFLDREERELDFIEGCFLLAIAGACVILFCIS